MEEEVLEKQEEVIDKKEQKRLKKEEKKRKKEEKKANKGNKSNKAEKKGGKGKKIIGLFIKFIILLAILFGISFFLVSNGIFGLDNSPLKDVLMNVPYVNQFLSSGEVEQGKTREELLIENDDYENKIQLLEDQLQTSLTKNEDLQLEIERLSQLESDYLNFREEKDAFDLEVASGEKVNYANYYSSIYPENADDIYRQIISDIETDEEVKRYISRFEALDSGSSAAILEELVFTDLDLVVNIIDGMAVDKSAEVLEKMDSTNASTILKRLTPNN